MKNMILKMVIQSVLIPLAIKALNYLSTKFSDLMEKANTAIEEYQQEAPTDVET